MTAGEETVRARDALLEAMLPHVPFDGWSAAALDAGARTLDLTPDDAGVVFPGGAEAAREWLDGWADRRMIERLRETDLSTLRIHQRVAAALKARLAALAPYREAVRLALASRVSPFGAPRAAQAVYRTVDAIWWEVGDASTDFSFYTKRGLLAAIHVSAVLYWLVDTSEDGGDTEAYIDRRIADVGRLPVLRRLAEDTLRRWRSAADDFRREARL